MKKNAEIKLNYLEELYHRGLSELFKHYCNITLKNEINIINEDYYYFRLQKTLNKYKESNNVIIDDGDYIIELNQLREYVKNEYTRIISKIKNKKSVQHLTKGF